jgi:RNA polymerase sigma-70 factor (ECF subfamily)
MEARDDVYHIEEVLKGNTTAFANLVNRYQDMVYTIAVRVLHNREDAEEVAQDAFVKAFRKLSTFRRESRFSTWLYRIAYNEAISKTRLKKIPELEFSEEINESTANEEIEEGMMGLDTAEQKLAIGKAVNRLTEHDQLLIRLFYYEDLPVSDIAKVTGLSESNVKVRLHRLRKKIYYELSEILKQKFYSLL